MTRESEGRPSAGWLPRKMEGDGYAWPDTLPVFELRCSHPTGFPYEYPDGVLLVGTFLTEDYARLVWSQLEHDHDLREELYSPELYPAMDRSVSDRHFFICEVPVAQSYDGWVSWRRSQMEKIHQDEMNAELWEDYQRSLGPII